MYAGQQARREAPYSGSSPVSSAAVRIESSSSSAVRGAVVQAGDRAGGDAHRLDRVQAFGARVTARTILLRSTGSLAPLRLVTRMVVAVGGGVRSKEGAIGASASKVLDIG
jgi:hypothetical protein